MNKKDYIEAIEEIRVSDKLKRETLQKITKQKKKRRVIYPIFATLALTCAILIAVVIPTKAPYENDDIIRTGNLPRLENFETLYKMLEKKAKEESKSGFWLDKSGGMLESATVDSVTSGSTTNTSKDFSQTNVQVEGVDEADIVKTDGKYIYYLTRETLVITDVEKMNVISKIEFTSKEANIYPNEMFLKGDNLVVICSKNNYINKTSYLNTYDVISDSSFVVANIYNIKDKKEPKLERTVEVEGSYLSSRMINGDVYIVANKYLYSYLCKDKDIEELNEDDFKPKYSDTIIGEETKFVDFDRIAYFPDFEDTSYLNILSFNVTEERPAKVESYLGAGNEIYASENNLYVAKPKYNYQNTIGNRYDLKTEIYKFKLENATCTFNKAGEVPGSILNQFSMDEKNGYFRIATTDSTDWNSDTTNNLYVLNENLEIVGKVEGLAKGERIYSVRFMGDRAYMVTFVQTDPLFVIDLSEPTNPKVLGELKIPGYSKYLHPYDNTHIIGFGENTKVVNYGYGDRVITDGMKMALFDVTDPNNPTEMYSVNIGGRGTYSELLYKHKALLFSKEKNLIAFPISITGEDYEVEFQGAIVYSLNLTKGFEEKGKITNIKDKIDGYYGSNSIERIIYVGDVLYTLSEDTIMATDLKTMKEMGKVKL